MYPLTVTNIPVPALALANVATGVPPRETSSLPTIPTRVAVPLNVASVVPSTLLFDAVRPEIDNCFGDTVNVCVTLVAAL